MFISKISAACLMTLALALPACAGSADSDEAIGQDEGAGKPDFSVPRVQAGRFVLKAPTPSPLDPHFVTLNLDSSGTATIHSSCTMCGGAPVLEGEPVVTGVPGDLLPGLPSYSEERVYRLVVSAGSCGALTYEGATADGLATVKIHDFRAATCLDVAAAVVVQETIGGVVRERWGTEQPVASK